jgi:hypothetical protein
MLTLQVLFQCQVTNRHAGPFAGYPMINTNCPINQQTAPVIIAWTDARLEYMHATVHLICRAVGNPMPQIEWYRLDDNERRHPLTDEIVRI